MPRNLTSSNSPGKLFNKNGVTLVETMIAIVIVGASMAGLLEMFSFGRIKIYQFGIKRQAIASLQGEMEYYRALRNKTPSGQPIASRGEQQVQIKSKDRTIRARVKPEDFSSVMAGTSHNFQQITLALTYEDNGHNDTLRLSTRMYLR